MKLDSETFFWQPGRDAPPFEPAPGCPSEEATASWLDGVLPAPAQRALEDHALACRDCSVVIRAAVDTRVRPAPFRVLARLLGRGVKLLNELELVFTAPPLRPALGALRRSQTLEPEMVSIRGPGAGIDEVQIQVLADGSARLLVACHRPPDLQQDEVASLLFDVDGAPREKRPFTGQPVAFEPLRQGRYSVRLVARRPGGRQRLISEAQVDLSA